MSLSSDILNKMNEANAPNYIGSDGETELGDDYDAAGRFTLEQAAKICIKVRESVMMPGDNDKEWVVFRIPFIF